MLCMVLAALEQLKRRSLVYRIHQEMSHDSSDCWDRKVVIQCLVDGQ